MPRYYADVLRDPVFGVIEQTARMRKIPNQPLLLSGMGVFKTKSITTRSFAVRIDQHKKRVLQTSARGIDGNTTEFYESRVKYLDTLYYATKDHVSADDIYTAGHIAPDNEIAAIATIQNLLDERQRQILDHFNLTWEFGRMMALTRGIIATIDDNSNPVTLVDLFDLFEVTQQNIDIPFSQADFEFEGLINELHQELDNRGATARTATKMICSPEFYDAMVSHPIIRNAVKFINGGVFLMQHHRSFEYQGIEWIRYGGNCLPASAETGAAAIPWVPAGKAYSLVDGLADLYQTVYSPADFVETVGKPGQPFYFKTMARKDDRGIDNLAITTATPIINIPDLTLQLSMT